MGIRSAYLNERVDSRLKRLNFILLGLMSFSSAIVAYDSIVFNTPLYYILFFMAGNLLGQLFKKTVSVAFDAERDTFTIRTSLVYFALTLMLTVLRFTLGKSLLDLLDVVYVSDAIYLLFIGLYYAKRRLVLKKIDQLVYEYAEKKYRQE